MTHQDLIARPEVNFKYIAQVLLAVLFTWLIHEFAHWSAGELLGNEMAMTINGGYPLAGKYLSSNHAIVVDAAGPLITLLQAIVFFIIIRKNHNMLLFPFVAICLYMRVIAAFLNVVNLNDEGRISLALGLGTYTIPVLICLALFYLVYVLIRTFRPGKRFTIYTFILIMIFSSIVVLGDQAFKFRLL